MGGLTTEVLMPFFDEGGLVLKDQLSNSAQLAWAEAKGIGELNGLEPDLRDRPCLAHVDVRWFLTLVAVEPEAEPVDDQERRHSSFLLRPPAAPGPLPW